METSVSQISRPRWSSLVLSVTTFLIVGLVWAVQAQTSPFPERAATQPSASPTAESLSPENPTVRATQYATELTNIPQAPDPQTAIDETLDGLDREVFLDAHIGAAPSPDDRQGMWFYATVKGVTDADGGYLPSVWQADLAQGAIADRLAQDETNLANVVVGSTMQFSGADGTTEAGLGGAGDIRAGQSFAADPSESDASIEASISKTLDSYGLSLAKIEVFHPLDTAVSVVATAPNLGVIDGKFDEIRAALLADPVRYEGIYFEIDVDGQPIVRASSSFRNGAGRLWLPPKYDNIVGAAHGGRAPA